METKNPRLVIVGGDAAGLSAAVQAKRTNPEIEVEVFEAGDYISYAACGMPYFLGGEVEDITRLYQNPEKFASARGLTIHTRHRVGHLDPEKKIIKGEGPEGSFEATYDQLVLATGVKPIILPLLADFGPEDGVFTMRGIGDALAIEKALKSRPEGEAVIFGAGFIGVELAETFVKLGRKVTLVNIDHSLLTPTTHPDMTKTMKALLEKIGVELAFGWKVQKVEKTGERFTLFFEEGKAERKIEADFIIQGVGVRPEVDYLSGSGIAFGESGGVKTDAFRRTNLPGVWAAGDMSEYQNALTGNWQLLPLAQPANRSGRIAGENAAQALAGGEATEKMPPVLGTAIARICEKGYARTGFTGDNMDGQPVTHISDQVADKPGYMPESGQTQVVLSMLSGGQLVGAQIFGAISEAKRIDFFALAISQRLSVKEIYDTETAYAPPFSPVYGAAIKTAGKAGLTL